MTYFRPFENIRMMKTALLMHVGNRVRLSAMNTGNKPHREKARKKERASHQTRAPFLSINCFRLWLPGLSSSLSGQKAGSYCRKKQERSIERKVTQISCLRSLGVPGNDIGLG